MLRGHRENYFKNTSSGLLPFQFFPINVKNLMEKYENHQSIRNWAEDDRPREKLRMKGKSSLSDAELLAILLGSGTRQESAVDLARRILKKANDNLIELSRFSLGDLTEFNGIGEAKAVTIQAALELGKRRN